MARGPSPWFAPMYLAADGWWEPFSCTRNNGDSSFSGDDADCPVITPFCAKGDSINQFIAKLRKLLDDPASAPFVSWAPDGLSFLLHFLKEFTGNVLPTHFNHASYSRLFIDLSTYGFRFRLVDDKLTEFAREGFVRGERLLFQKGFGLKLKDIDQTVYAKEGFIRWQTHPLQKDFGLKLEDLDQTVYAEEGFVRGQTDPLQKVGTPVPLQSSLSCLSEESKVKEETKGRLSISRLFHSKVYFMVDDPATDHIISWDPSCRSFVVRNPMELCKVLLYKYFEHRDFYKFVMLLCLNGFRFRSMSDLKQFEFAKEGFVRRPQQGPCLKKIKIEEDTTGDRVEIKRKMSELEERLQSSMQVPCGGLEREAIIDIKKEMEELKERVKEMEEPSLHEMEMEKVLEDLMEIKQEFGKMKEQLKRRDAFMDEICEMIGKHKNEIPDCFRSLVKEELRALCSLLSDSSTGCGGM